MQLHQIKPTLARETRKRIGRGGKRGKTSGRGGKGQTARTGTSGRPEMRDIIKRLPKLRGFGKNRGRTVNSERALPVVINLATLSQHYPKGGEVSPALLVTAGIVKKTGGRVPAVKILANGEITSKLAVRGCLLSDSARAKVVAAGGTVA
jgi:large subunit ribosomal protein L15